MPRARAGTTAQTVTTTTETAIVTSPGISPPTNSVIDIIAITDFTTGATTTGVTINIRRGSGIAGFQVATLGPIAVAASTRVLLTVSCFDSLGIDVANQTYSLTVTQVAATGNGTGNVNQIRCDWG